MRSDCSLNSSIAARFTCPSRSIFSAVSASRCSQAGDVGLRHQRRDDLGEFEPRRGELLEQRLATQPQLLHRELDVLEQVAGVLHGGLGRDALLVELAQAGVDRLERAPRRAEFLLDRDPLLQRLLAAPPRAAPSASSLAASCAVEVGRAAPRTARSVRRAASRLASSDAWPGAARLDADRDFARGVARLLGSLPRVGQRLAQRVALRLERAALLLEFGHAADGLLEPRARGAVAGVRHLERALELGELRA